MPRPVLKPGVRSLDVFPLVAALEAVGFGRKSRADERFYGPELQAVVRAFQMDEGLTVDGVVGPQTWARLSRVAGTLPAGEQPRHNRDLRLQAVLQTAWSCDDGQGTRYCGYGRTDRLTGPTLTVPIGSGKVRPQLDMTVVPPHTWGTCGHLAWLVVAGWLNDDQRTFQTGRMNGPGAPGYTNWVCTMPWSGVDVNGVLHRGYQDYSTELFSVGKRWGTREPIGKTLWEQQDKLKTVNLVVRSTGHVRLILRVHPETCMLLDPRTRRPMRQGLYWFAADGNSAGGLYSAQKTTLRLLSPTDTWASLCGWKLWTIDDPDEDGSLHHGPLADNTPLWPVLE